ncbi:MAG: cadherin-like domain-containing protein [Acidobacteria bacterium]|nr:cadherin-like domain-containing protein [Acidobacteriota bacterium]
MALVVAGALALGLWAGFSPTATGQSGERVPTFASSEPPAPLGRSAGEPSLGVTRTIVPPDLLGRVMYIAGTQTLRVTYDDCTSPPGALWQNVSFTTTSVTTLDPILFTDPETGRTFVSQLAGKTSLMAFTDTEGRTWTPSQGGGINSGVDHQTVGSGPYPAGDPGSVPTADYENAVYYCSQDIATAQCALSRDGGLTFGPAVPIYAITECGGLHGHVKVAPDGTAYVPNPSCNRQGDPFDPGEPGLVRSEDAGVTWKVRTVPGAQTIGSSDPAVGIGRDGTLYFGYEDQGHAGIAVSHDRGESWTFVRDVSTQAGLKHIVFPQVTAGDDNRAAIAFLGTDYSGPGDPEGEDPDLPAVWHMYVAATYDGGNSWVTTNATPGDPVQRGTICGAGVSCETTRNLLDFNDVTIDKDGRILAAYADGCIGSCLNGPPNSRTALAKIARQVSGKRLFAAADPPPPGGKPAAVLLQAILKDSPSRVELSWSEPDDRLSDITSYNVYRRRTDISGQSQILLATLGGSARSYTDATIVSGQTYAYEVTAVNANGEGDRCREVAPIVPPPRRPCDLPGDVVSTDRAGDAPTTSLDIRQLNIAEPAQPDRLDRLVFTLKVENLTTPLQPNNAWIILWNRPRPDSNFDRNYVAMRVDSTGTAGFKFGKISPPSVNQAFDMGDADSGSFSATDDTIVITISNSKVDNPMAGQDLTGIEVRTFVSNVSGQPVTGLTAQDTSAAGFYTLVGNAFCDPKPFAVDDSAATPEGQAVTINVLANDIDGNGDPLTVVSVADPLNGSTRINIDSTVTYTPDAFFVGTDTFDYTITDNRDGTDIGTVTVLVFRVAPFQNPIADDATPDQVDGVDKDGNYRLSWTFPPPPDSQPSCFRIEEARSFGTLFSDDAEVFLADPNSKWTGDAEWISSVHPDTETLGYSIVYHDESDISLTMKNAVAIPAGPTKAFLAFDSFEDIENNFDFGLVEVSVDGGPFDTLATYTGQFSGTRLVDLSDFAGRSIRIRFRFVSDLLVSFPLFLGWFIDNIEIQNAQFVPIDTVGGSTFGFDVTNRESGTYIYRIAGLFGAGCNAVGPYSNLREITVQREQEPPRLAPTADFTATPNPAQVNQQVMFDGSASTDNDSVGCTSAPANNNCIVRYFWSFGDGTTQTTTGPVTTHSYGSPGTYRATLTVTDNDGQTSTAELFVTVTEAPVPGEQKATGGGWISSGNSRANFGFNATRSLAGQTSGHLTYDDKGAKVKVMSESISSLVLTGNKATFSGSCTVNKKSGFTFTVEVTDEGEPGTSDTFTIRLSNGYATGGTLGGGNIQIHN